MVKDTIIIVDDDPHILKSLEMLLKGYKVIRFVEPRQALEYFQRDGTASCAVIDVVLPEMNGISLLKAIKEIQDIPIMITTAYSSKEVAIKALRNHADDYMEKPFDVNEFRQKLDALLKLKSSQGGAEVKNEVPHVDRIKSFIERNYKNASLAFIAEEMCLSPKYISRMFQEKNREGFREYKLNVRIDKAKELLQKSSFNISEIAFQLGYQNPESFMRIFKRMTSQTPMQYRKEYRRKIKVKS